MAKQRFKCDLLFDWNIMEYKKKSPREPNVLLVRGKQDCLTPKASSLRGSLRSSHHKEELPVPRTSMEPNPSEVPEQIITEQVPITIDYNAVIAGSLATTDQPSVTKEAAPEEEHKEETKVNQDNTLLALKGPDLPGEKKEMTLKEYYKSNCTSTEVSACVVGKKKGRKKKKKKRHQHEYTILFIHRVSDSPSPKVTEKRPGCSIV